MRPPGGRAAEGLWNLSGRGRGLYGADPVCDGSGTGEDGHQTEKCARRPGELDFPDIPRGIGQRVWIYGGADGRQCVYHCTERRASVLPCTDGSGDGTGVPVFFR